MPVYALKCQDCGERFDVLASIREKEEKKDPRFNCLKCGSSKTVFRFSLPNLFKGGGSCGCSGGGCCG